MTVPPCHCGGNRRRTQEVCTSCWVQLRVWVKDALKKRDALSAQRSRELHQQILDGRPLSEIEVTS